MSDDQPKQRRGTGEPDVDSAAALRSMMEPAVRRSVRDELRSRTVERLSDDRSEFDEQTAAKIVADATADTAARWSAGAATSDDDTTACGVLDPITTDPALADFTRGAKTLKDWVPALHDPLKIVCVTIHVFQDPFGKGHYTEEDMPEILEIFYWATHMFERPAAPWTGGVKLPPNTPPLCMPYAHRYDGDTRIRFHLANVRFHRSAQFHATPGYRWNTAQGKRESEVMLNHVLDLFPEDAATVNVLWNSGQDFVGDDGETQTNSPHANMDFPSKVYQGFGRPDHWMPYSQMTAHEIAHAVGLEHISLDEPHPSWFLPLPLLFDPEDSEYLCDVFGIGKPGGPYVPRSQSNNVMEPRGGHWISKLQSATVHRALTESRLAGLVANSKPNPCCTCLGAVAFSATAVHSASASTPLRWKVKFDRGFGWARSIPGGDPFVYVVPASGTYHLDLSFVRDSSSAQFSQPGTTDDVYLGIRVNSHQIASAWAGETKRRDRDRATGARAVNVELQSGDLITVDSTSDSGQRLNVFANFSGHLLR